MKKINIILELSIEFITKILVFLYKKILNTKLEVIFNIVTLPIALIFCCATLLVEGFYWIKEYLELRAKEWNDGRPWIN